MIPPIPPNHAYRFPDFHKTRLLRFLDYGGGLAFHSVSLPIDDPRRTAADGERAPAAIRAAPPYSPTIAPRSSTSSLRGEPGRPGIVTMFPAIG